MKRVYFNFLIFMMIFSLLVICSESRVVAKPIFSKILPKTKETKIKKDKDNDENDSSEVESEEEDFSETNIDKSSEESEEDDIEKAVQAYKLVAVYQFAGEPRALIKDLQKLEDGAKEFKVGEYIDEEETLLVSKILFNPTSRIELTDKDGLAYLIKPQISEDSGLSQNMSSFSRSSYPIMSVYRNIKNSADTSSQPAPQAVQQVQATPAPQAAQQVQATPAPQAAQQAQATPAPQAAQQAQATPAPQAAQQAQNPSGTDSSSASTASQTTTNPVPSQEPPKAVDPLGRDRPSNVYD